MGKVYNINPDSWKDRERVAEYRSTKATQLLAELKFKVSIGAITAEEVDKEITSIERRYLSKPLK